MKALAQRYASALVEVAIKDGTAEQVKNELAAFAAVLETSTDLRNFLSSPAVSRTSKQGVIGKVVSGLGASKTLRNFLFVMTDNRRVSLLPQIRQAFETLLNARLGVVEAQITSVRELNMQEKADLSQVLERLTGKRVEARYGVDPALLGGAVVRIGSTIYDGSIRAQFNLLRTRLASE